MMGFVSPDKSSQTCEVYGVSSSSFLNVPSSGLGCVMVGSRGLGRVMKDEMIRAGKEVAMVEISEEVNAGSASGRTKTQVVSAMSVRDLPHNEILRTQQTTSEMREKIIETIRPHFKNNELFVELDSNRSLTTDLGLNRFIRQEPECLIALKNDKGFSHLKGIIYDGGTENNSSKIAVMFRFDDPSMRVVGRPNITPVIPDIYLSEDARLAQKIVVEQQANINQDNVLKMN